MSVPLLTTKLSVPPLRRAIVIQPRLLQRLEESLNLGHRLTLVSAPPGYGKTTLITQWLCQTQQPFAWVSLDEGDDDPSRFATYLIAALSKIDEQVGQATQSLLALPPLQPVDSLLAPLINDLAKTSTPFTLVLDDFHVVRTQVIYDMVGFLLEHQPPQMHLVLITREDPPLPLARLRARGQILEIRTRDLCFTLDETAEYLNRTMGLSLGTAEVAALAARTEGWIAGLQLAALSLQGREEPGEFIEAFSGSNRHVFEYLADEVLRRQSDEIRRFLIQTSVLDRLSAPLCDALTDRCDSKAILTRLEQANLFLEPLGSDGKWFRYHHLFAEVLREGLAGEEATVSHRRAARWFEANGFLPEAVRHDLAAGDEAEAGRLIGLAAREALRRGEIATLLGWIEALPASLVESNVGLMVHKALSLLLLRRTKAAASAIAALEPLVSAETAPAEMGKFLALRAWLANLRNETETVSLAREALSLIPKTESALRLTTVFALGEAEFWRDDILAAIQTFREAYQLGQELGYPYATLGAIGYMAAILDRLGQRREAANLCEHAVEEYVSAYGRSLPPLALVYVLWGLVCYEANELEEARDHLLRGIEFCRQATLDRIALATGEWVLAKVQLACGQLDDALKTAREARQMAEKEGLSRFVTLLMVQEAEIEIRRGNLTAAANLVGSSGPSPAEAHDTVYEQGSLIQVRLLLAQSRLEEARSRLAELEGAARKKERSGVLIGVHVLQAFTEKMLGRSIEAVHYIEQALALAAPEDYYRAFLNEGNAIAELLPEARPVAPAFVDELLHAMQGAGMEPAPDVRPPTPISDPLSPRELEVLRFIADGLSNDEIARQMVVTLSTAKWHVHNVLGKLGANSRTKALVRARELQLI